MTCQSYQVLEDLWELFQDLQTDTPTYGEVVVDMNDGLPVLRILTPSGEVRIEGTAAGMVVLEYPKNYRPNTNLPKAGEINFRQLKAVFEYFTGYDVAVKINLDEEKTMNNKENAQQNENTQEQKADQQGQQEGKGYKSGYDAGYNDGKRTGFMGGVAAGVGLAALAAGGVVAYNHFFNKSAE